MHAISPQSIVAQMFYFVKFFEYNPAILRMASQTIDIIGNNPQISATGSSLTGSCLKFQYKNLRESRGLPVPSNLWIKMAACAITDKV